MPRAAPAAKAAAELADEEEDDDDIEKKSTERESGCFCLSFRAKRVPERRRFFFVLR